MESMDVWAQLILEERVSPLQLTVEFMGDSTPQHIDELFVALATQLPKQHFETVGKTGIPAMDQSATLQFSPSEGSKIHIKQFTVTLITGFSDDNEVVTITLPGSELGPEGEVALEPNVPIYVVVNYQRNKSDGTQEAFTESFTVISSQ